MSIIAALALAAQAAPVPAASTDAELTDLFASICQRDEVPGGEFRSVAEEEIPVGLRHFYIGPHEGRYWRREGERPAFVVLTRGPGHWAGIEQYCTVAVQGVAFEDMVAAFAARLPGHNVSRDEQGGTTRVAYFANRGGSVDIRQMPGGWVSLVCGGMINRVAPICHLSSKGTQ